MWLNLALSNRLNVFSGEDENVKEEVVEKNINLNGAWDNEYVGGNN